jgi:hypothetical protein
MSSLLDEILDKLWGKAKEVSQFMLQLQKEKELADQLKMTVLPTTAMETETLKGVIPRPVGGILQKGSITTTSTYQTVASHVPTGKKTFQLTKIVISASKASWFKFRWNGADISSERLMDDKTIVIEHFPWDYADMVGDGSKSFDVQAKYDSESGACKVEIVGEEL